MGNVIQDRKTGLQPLKIGEKTAEIPVIQGGMGVGVSLSRLAGAVAKEGGVGVISTAQIGFEDPDFKKDPAACNLRAIRSHIRKAKEIAGGHGMIGVNIMVALRHYREHVAEAAAAGADLIISGAGLPMDLPALVGTDSPVKIAPIVSSGRAAQLILKMWAHRYQRTADAIVVEGPEAGGHLGFSGEDLLTPGKIDFDREVRQVIQIKKAYEQQFKKKIPVIVAGGIFDREDIAHAAALGADGVQIASRFVATEECDASDAYKQAYIQAKESDITIIKSPVGMPGRALKNALIRKLEQTKEPVSRCYQCLQKCDPATVPYCITSALIRAVRGDVENGLVFCGANVGKIHQMTTVPQLMRELFG